MVRSQALNYILKNKDLSFIIDNDLDASYFPGFEQEFNFIMDHYKEFGELPDLYTVVDKTKLDVIEVSESKEYLLKELNKVKNYEILVPIINKVIETSKKDPTEALDLYLSSSNSLRARTKADAIELYNNKSRFDNFIKKSRNTNPSYIPTGFKELDEILGGWDATDELAVIAARTNQGKSWLLLKTAIAAADAGRVVGIYSGEMSADKVGYRIDTMRSHISNWKLTHGVVDIQPEYEKYINEQAKDCKGKIFIVTPQDLGGPATISKLQSFIDKYAIDFMCVDQYSLLDDERGARNSIDRFANLSKDMKNLQVMKKIPFIVVSQQNRGETENGPDSKNISGSDRIAQDATTILFFEQKDGKLTMFLGKARDAKVGDKLTYAWDIDKGIFTFLPSENDATNGAHTEEVRESFKDKDDSVF